MPAVLNAANEVAVDKFLSRQISFSGIWRLVEAVMSRHTVIPEPVLEEVIEADAWARRAAEEG
jgi:1-deoxy-D-xylulose-5-phosphate reductoisomerase